MDPLSITGSVIAVAGLAVQSAQAATKAIDGLQEAPQVISHSRVLLSGTEDTLRALDGVLRSNSSNTTTASTHLGAVLRDIRLQRALDSTKSLCDRFTAAISQYTAHSTGPALSKRDRLNVGLHASEIARFNRQLNGCQDTITVAVTAVTLLISSCTSHEVLRMDSRFSALEQTLSALSLKLSQEATDHPMLEDKMQQLEIEDEQSSRDRNGALQDTCKAALKASQATRTGQTFGDMQADKSTAMQGIVGAAQKGLEQTFGKMVAQNESRAFQGQLDSNAFAAMFK
ncbi:hypothetical protein PG993_011790 [Apiospora rasikravindrae]|uniref:Azaphilone pigments biosynthesis cluster protein L N-terminal domain-containing protein n=1 Tax=Apiospora rasikravindrae TaxID=990691 RepID=A0ABR1S0M7_9PEZI